jgi:PAB-dependent poly(A)-specific ribonuclease subunit 3
VVAKRYSPDVKNLITLLLAKPSLGGSSGAPPITISYIAQLISHRMIGTLQHSLSHIDATEAEIAREVANGRYLRLLIKLGMINERPEYEPAGTAPDGSPLPPRERDARDRWSETGDRYLLKLFRDYVFHTQHSDGSPNVDFGWGTDEPPNHRTGRLSRGSHCSDAF